MNNGWTKLYRNLLDSRVFQSEGLLKVWIWCLLKASHKKTWIPIKTGKGSTEIQLLPGQFFFGRESAGKQLKMNPSTARNRIKKLENMGYLAIENHSHYSIVSLNPSHFSESTPKKDTQKGQAKLSQISCQSKLFSNLTDEKGHPKRTGKGQAKDTNKNVKNKENKEDPIFSVSIENLKKRYSDPNLIDRTIDAIRTTRKTGRIADSIIFGLLQSLDKYSVQQVQVGCRIYLNKSYHLQGKDEKYFLGIVRKQSEKPVQTEEAGPSSGSPLLDIYYKNPESYRIVET